MCASGAVARHDSTAIARPRWIALYGIATLGLAALAVTEIAASAIVRPAFESVVGGVAFLAIAVWLRRNRAALDQQAWCECAAETLMVRVIPSRRPEPIRSAPPRVPDVLPAEDDEDARVLVLTS
jgi:putative Ca2+/H+ antiporter (TMEM165/GDT1 family)